MDMFNHVNIEADPITTECVEDNPDEKWKCLLPEYVIQYVKTPVFVT